MLSGCGISLNPFHYLNYLNPFHYMFGDDDDGDVKQSGGVVGSKSYVVFGKRYYPLKSAKNFVQEGIASWYGKDFHGKKTANGERYNMYAMTAAHKTLPMNTRVRVTNLNNGKTMIVRINDRGPFGGSRIIDLSYTAASRLGIAQKGIGRVRIKAIE
jgi:rare lipoprotein A